MASTDNDSQRLSKLKTLAWVLLVLLFCKVLISIVSEYRFYFPADFNSDFLTGRRPHFHGLYKAAFYSHIIVGPIAILAGAFLMFSGGKKRFRTIHRMTGRVLVLGIVMVLTPSGLVMSTQAFSGAVAGWGFASLSVLTGLSAILVAYNARSRKFAVHQRWATRCVIFLCSPLLLRLTTGAVFVANVESALTYQLSAWLSWLVPLAIYEIWRVWSTRRSQGNKTIALESKLG